MKIVKEFFNIIFSFILVIAISTLVFLYILKSSVYNKNYVYSKMDEVEFYEETSRAVKSGFEKYEYQSGFPLEMFDDLYTDELIKEDVNSSIRYIYDDEDIKYSSSVIKDNLHQKINEYLLSNDMKTDKLGSSNITKFEKLIENEYNNNIHVKKTVIDEIKTAISKSQPIVNKVYVIVLPVSIIGILLILIINRKDLNNGFLYFGIIFLVIGILFKLGLNQVNKNIEIDNVLLFSMALSKLVIAISKDILNKINEIANWFIISSSTIIVVFSIIRGIPSKKERMELKKQKLSQQENQNEIPNNSDDNEDFVKITRRRKKSRMETEINQNESK